ncbi:MAG TPA: FAD-dependent oxidoreductase [Firmicutes bacterium]|nr:FAD-dependent oxidoreductase [Bacillota bacterium]
MVKVLVIGGGWSGCGAALAAAKAGAQVTLLEKTDQLLGTGLVGGIMRNNGRYTAAEEAIALGGGELFKIADAVARHRNIDFPGHKHATLYDVTKIEPAVRKLLQERGIDIQLETRAGAVDMQEGSRFIKSVRSDTGRSFTADVFVETTGTAGPQGNCLKYGNGCAMCILRCPSYGPRVSIAAKAGIQEMIGGSSVGTLGAMSGSCKLLKESLAHGIQERLNREGVVVVPLPPELQKKDLAKKACQQYNLKEYAENIILLDTGHAKLMAPYFPLNKLRQIPGFENARFEDPYAGGRGNSIRYLAISPRDNYLKVEGLENLFCGGEKAGPLVGHTEAIVTGTLAGHNAVRWACGKELLALPRTLAIGDAIAFVREQLETTEGLRKKYTFSGSIYFQRMQELGLYTTDRKKIEDRVAAAGLTGIYDRQIV